LQIQTLCAFVRNIFGLTLIGRKKIRTMNESNAIITIEPGKRGGKPTIRGMRITVGDILGWLASGMTVQEILSDFEELTEENVFAALRYAASRENRTYLKAV